MVPSNHISIRENASYQYDVFDGKEWLGCFRWFKDAAEYAAKVQITKDERLSRYRHVIVSSDQTQG